MTLSGAAIINLSAILGPAFGGLVKTYLGIKWVFWIVACLLFKTAVVVRLFLPRRDGHFWTRIGAVISGYDCLSGGSYTKFTCGKFLPDNSHNDKYF